MRFVIKNVIFFIFLPIFLASCANKYYVPEQMPLFKQMTFSITDEKNINILLVSKKNDEYYFLYQNSFFVPLSKKILKNNTFEDDGFFMPNKNLNDLFMEILHLIKEKKQHKKIKLKNGKVYEANLLS